jgi:hypothetical protein
MFAFNALIQYLNILMILCMKQSFVACSFPLVASPLVFRRFSMSESFGLGIFHLGMLKRLGDM